MNLPYIDKSQKFSQFFEKVTETRKISFLVLHHIEANSCELAIEELKKHEVSSHFLIDEKGVIFELVNENDIAYHAGVSFWNQVDALNKFSIGIEFLTKDALKDGYTKSQIESGSKLCKYLIDKYNIPAQNIVGHSDIAYCKENGFLDRKQDPSHLFDWKYLSKNKIGIYPNVDFKGDDEVLFKIGDEDKEIKKIKESLSKFGYKITNFNNYFDEEMQLLMRVFHRRFNQIKFNSDPDCYYKSSQLILKAL